MIKRYLLFGFTACLLTCFNARTTITASNEPWNFLILAQFWAGTSCVYYKEKKCAVPPDTPGWTIHGLWPTSDDPPEFCNDSMTFSYTQIKVLRHQLDKQWPNLNESGDPLFLWKHEWNKHGTCACNLPTLQGELKYFNTTLQMHGHLDIHGALLKENIIPDKTKLYDLTDIFFAVVNSYSKYPQIKCTNLNGKIYLEEIWQCYDKTLDIIDCPEINQNSKGKSVRVEEYLDKQENSLYLQSEIHGYFKDCPKDGGVLYVPIPTGQRLT